jgi:predicted hotdog family 3-hydroxylacyl-ACP dehydratase
VSSPDANAGASPYAAFAGRPASEFLLHEAPMALLDRVVEVDRDGALCTCLTGPDSLFCLPGTGVPGWTAIEFMAQCIAVSAGACAKVENRPIPLGLLLGTRHMKLRLDVFDPDREYRVESRLNFKDDSGMAAHECRVLQGSTIVAQARLTAKEIQRGEDSGVELP